MNNWISTHVVFPLMLKFYGENALEKLREFERTQWLSPEALEEFQFNKTKKMFCYAYERIPYYRKRFDEYGLKPTQIQSFSDLDNYPVLTKEEIKNHCEELMAAHRPKRFEKRSTSGTTGLPLSFIKDREATACMRAIECRAYEWHDIKPGMRRGDFRTSALSTRALFQEKVKDLLLNRRRYSVFTFSEHRFREYYTAMRRFKPTYLYGYPSAIVEIANYMLEHMLPPPTSLKLIVATSEMLLPLHKHSIEEAFKCKCVNEYGCTEVGIIAFECPEGHLHVMSDNLCVEFTRDGKKLPPKEAGDILVSELNNFSMPFLRYQIGDMGSYRLGKCECGRDLPLMHSLNGRQNSFFKTPDGRLVYDNIFDFLGEHPSIRTFKVTLERPDSILIEIVFEKTLSFKKTLDEFRTTIQNLVGNAMNIRFQAVETIGRSSSGKRNYFESLV